MKIFNRRTIAQRLQNPGIRPSLISLMAITSDNRVLVSGYLQILARVSSGTNVDELTTGAFLIYY